jgi:hypothetical protein
VVTALEEALRTACEQRQLDPVGAQLIHHYSNAVYLLRAEPAIARIATGSETRTPSRAPNHHQLPRPRPRLRGLYSTAGHRPGRGRQRGAPRVVDLIPTWHAAVRYGRDEVWIQDFIKHCGYDLRDWAGYPTLRTMRDLAQLPGPLPGREPAQAAALRHGSAPSATATAPQPGSL